MQEIATILGNGFFPVVMCGVLFWYVTKKDDQHKEEINALRDSMDSNNRMFIEALAKVETAVNRLTEALHANND